ncbi:MAG: hypothetical protein WC613_01100 [Candidatus Aenigmatarchaeota archaeon]
MPRNIGRKVAGIIGAAAFVAAGVNVTDYIIARGRLSQGYTRAQIEERFDYNKLMANGDPLGAVCSVIGKPGRDLAYRK